MTWSIKFIGKPWDDQQLRHHLDDAFRHKEMAEENQRHNLEFNKEFKEENQRLNIKTKTLSQALSSAHLKLEKIIAQQEQQNLRDKVQHDILSEMLEHIPLPMIGLDDDGVIVFVNTAAEALFAFHGPILGSDARGLLPVLRDATSCHGADSALSVSIQKSAVPYHFPAYGRALAIQR